MWAILNKSGSFYFFFHSAAISAHVGDIAIPAVDYSSEEEEGTDELTSLDTGSSDTSSISSMGKQAILEEVTEKLKQSRKELLKFTIVKMTSCS